MVQRGPTIGGDGGGPFEFFRDDQPVEQVDLWYGRGSGEDFKQFTVLKGIEVHWADGSCDGAGSRPNEDNHDILHTSFDFENNGDEKLQWMDIYGSAGRVDSLRFMTDRHHEGDYFAAGGVGGGIRVQPAVGRKLYTMTAVMVIVEDEEGDVLMLQLYNQEEGLSAQGRLIEGTVIIVEEPYLKAMSDGDYGIRVDHLPDVRFIPDHGILIPSSWRRQLMENDASANYWKLKAADGWPYTAIAPLRDSRNKRAASISSHDCSLRRKNVAHQFLIMRPTLVLWL
ncbi:hypothetical protein CNMCM8694_005645 [Aspergillus lentulus]|nr:hypothetical protein CNMCM8060_004224 [Aspergillus lentulus]KAF4195903.1 hypothetical protein CNMCM8694_005645 [Aspergillus lentulus]